MGDIVVEFLVAFECSAGCRPGGNNDDALEAFCVHFCEVPRLQSWSVYECEWKVCRTCCH